MPFPMLQPERQLTERCPLYPEQVLRAPPDMHPANRCDHTPGPLGRCRCAKCYGPICLCLPFLLQKYLENYLNRLLTMSFYRNYHAMVRFRDGCLVLRWSRIVRPPRGRGLQSVWSEGLKARVCPLSLCFFCRQSSWKSVSYPLSQTLDAKDCKCVTPLTQPPVKCLNLSLPENGECSEGWAGGLESPSSISS